MITEVSEGLKLQLVCSGVLYLLSRKSRRSDCSRRPKSTLQRKKGKLKSAPFTIRTLFSRRETSPFCSVLVVFPSHFCDFFSDNCPRLCSPRTLCFPAHNVKLATILPKYSRQINNSESNKHVIITLSTCDLAKPGADMRVSLRATGNLGKPESWTSDYSYRLRKLVKLSRTTNQNKCNTTNIL